MLPVQQTQLRRNFIARNQILGTRRNSRGAKIHDILLILKCHCLLLNSILPWIHVRIECVVGIVYGFAHSSTNYGRVACRQMMLPVPRARPRLVMS